MEYHLCIVFVSSMQPLCEKDVKTHAPSCSIQVDVSSKHEVNLSVKVCYFDMSIWSWNKEPLFFVLFEVRYYSVIFPSCYLQVMLNPLEVTYDSKFFLHLSEFFDEFKSFESLHRRVRLFAFLVYSVLGCLL